MEFLITDAELLPKLASVAHKLNNLKYVIYIGEISKTTMLNFPSTFKMMSMVDVEDLGARPENGKKFSSLSRKRSYS